MCVKKLKNFRFSKCRGSAMSVLFCQITIYSKKTFESNDEASFIGSVEAFLSRCGRNRRSEVYVINAHILKNMSSECYQIKIATCEQWPEKWQT
ncbi:hypothetical protein OUZ56_016802 [Daphnia magna]|uniref:Uncharacterized protein n=1 Tax=Daphnia magna TaxID=35525 RepID=A0ABR0ARP6_9CRUS|nr:hypothetical protein OUZ56_016802 [Daphnia magna]